MVIVLAIFVGVLLPLYAVYEAWSGRGGSRLSWLTKVVSAIGFMGFLSFVARWDWLSAYLPWLYWALIQSAAPMSMRRPATTLSSRARGSASSSRISGRGR